VGSQYRSAIFYTDTDQKKMAMAYAQQITNAHIFTGPIVTQIMPLHQFYRAEEFHQNYLALHPYQPYIVFNDMPKLAHLRKQFPALYK
jgi:peptide-methionine (S)-S-oxide reductase